MTPFDVIVMQFFFTIWPGLAFACVSSTAIEFGRKKALCFGFGDVLAQGVFKVLGLLGVGFILQANPQLYKFLQIAGMCYIIYFVWQMFIAKNLNLANTGLDHQNHSEKYFVRKGFVFSICYIASALVYLTMFSSLNSDVTMTVKVLLVFWMMGVNMAYHTLVSWIFTHEKLYPTVQKHLGSVRKVSLAMIAVFVYKMVSEIISTL